ncbi:MAG: cytosine permease [Clostridiales bacterium]|nr:cytosine permease [Clostridiales bacterium]
MKTQIINPMGIVALTGEAIDSRKDSPLWNEDLRPCTMEEHTWRTYNYAALWIGMCICLPTYSMAIGLIQSGMNLAQAMITMIAGNIIILVVILLNSNAGTKYGIPYAVFARLWFGLKGAHIPTIVRGTIAAGWFGLNCWFGATAIDACVAAFAKGWANVTGHAYIIFIAFWVINIIVGIFGPQAMKKLAAFAGPLLGAAAVVLFIWAIMAVSKTPGGVGQIFAYQPTFASNGAFAHAFLVGLIAVIAFWATLALNIPDFCRYAKSQKTHIVGQSIALPVTMALFSLVAIMTTFAIIAVEGKPLGDPDALAAYSTPVTLIVQFPAFVVLIGAIIIAISSLTLNVNANLMAPARMFENFAPKKINFAMGAILTGILALILWPPALLNAGILNWLSVYGAFLAVVDGIAVADYWIVRKRNMNLIELYNPEESGIYNYSKGFNMAAVITFVVASVVMLIILLAPGLGTGSMAFSVNWFIGMAIALILYPIMMRNHKSVISIAQFDEITTYMDGSKDKTA